ncbi:GTP-binding_nuclear protein RAN/TC4 [Hexamita inflata]|uniref:GTP-binding nuclear protein RAN/TC4 n=1 Tax=Hexamita inflata TaxID=28002 RepID=A0AA86RA96_9EUKA|nr:GTP-binding nuclear protein RAN/TC4 [Hexamita inflata]
MDVLVKPHSSPAINLVNSNVNTSQPSVLTFVFFHSTLQLVKFISKFTILLVRKSSVDSVIQVAFQNREVRTQAVNWHRKKGIKYVEMSAKSNYNYEVPFLLLCRILARDESLNFTQAPALVPAEINMSEQQMNQIHNDMMKANMAALPDQDE